MKSNGVWKNKKAVVVVAILVLALLAGGTYVATRNTDSHSKAKTTTQSEEKAKKEKEDKKEQKEAEKALEEAKASGDEKAIKEAEAKVEKAKAKTKAASSPSGGSTQNSSAPASGTPKPADKKKVWIVDKAAWTETVQEPVYATREKFILKGYDGTSYGAYYSEAEVQSKQAELMDLDIMTHYSISSEQYISGYNTKTINHPEEGHWEYR